MKGSLLIWGLILLIGFGASQMALDAGQVSASMLWMAWAVVFLIGHWAIGKTMKKMPKEMGALWMSATVFGLIVSFAVALDYLAAPFAGLMGLWLILVGAAWFASGYSAKSAMGVSWGLIYVFLGLATPMWFPANYFLAGALIFGIPHIMAALGPKKM